MSYIYERLAISWRLSYEWRRENQEAPCTWAVTTHDFNASKTRHKRHVLTHYLIHMTRYPLSIDATPRSIFPKGVSHIGELAIYMVKHLLFVSYEATDLYQLCS